MLGNTKVWMLKLIIFVTAGNICFLTSFIVGASIKSTPVDDELFRLFIIFNYILFIDQFEIKCALSFPHGFPKIGKGICFYLGDGASESFHLVDKEIVHCACQTGGRTY